MPLPTHDELPTRLKRAIDDLQAKILLCGIRCDKEGQAGLEKGTEEVLQSFAEFERLNKEYVSEVSELAESLRKGVIQTPIRRPDRWD